MIRLTRQRSFFLIAAACGALGVVSGYAVFDNYPEIQADPNGFIAALAVAALLSYLIEWLREVIRRGEIERQDHAIARALGTFALLLVLELFIAAFHGSAEAGTTGIFSAAIALLGDEAQKWQGARWTLWLVAGCWVVVGAMLAAWLALGVLLFSPKDRESDGAAALQRVAPMAGWGGIGGIFLAPIVIGFYILCGRVLVTFAYFFTHKQGEAARLMGTLTPFHVCAWSNLIDPKVWMHNLSGFLIATPYALMESAARRSVPLFWLVFACLVALLVWMLKRLFSGSESGNAAWLLFCLILGLFGSTLAFFVESIWTVVHQVWQQGLGPIFSALKVGALVWAIPGLALGALLPLLRRPARSPREWAFIGYGAALLLMLATSLRWLAPGVSHPVWPLIPAVIAAIAGLLFQYGMPVKEFWPFAAFCVAVGVTATSSIAQNITFRDVLLSVHKIDQLKPPEKAVSQYEDRRLAPVIDWTIRFPPRPRIHFFWQKPEAPSAETATPPYNCNQVATAEEATPPQLSQVEAVSVRESAPPAPPSGDSESGAGMSQPATSGNAVKPGTGASRGKADQAGAPGWDKMMPDDASKVLELAISGSVGFWITVGLLACWSLYEHEEDREELEPE